MAAVVEKNDPVLTCPCETSTSAAAGDSKPLAPCIAYVWFLHERSNEGKNRTAENSGEDEEKVLPSPLVFTPQFPIQRVSCGVSLAAFVTHDGRVFTWRLPNYDSPNAVTEAKQLGCPKTLNVVNGRRVTDVACGDHHICCLCDNGEVLTTGCYHYGQLGTMPSEGPSHTTPLDRESDNQDALLPCSSCFCGKQETSKEARFIFDVFLLTFNVPVVDIACGPRQTLVVTSSGTVWGMGQGVAAWESSGAQSLPSSSALLELIYYSPKLLQLTPSTHAPACRIQQVACGNGHFLGLTDNGNVMSWGNNSSGQLGHGTISPHALPQTVSFQSPPTGSCGQSETTALDSPMPMAFVDAAQASIAISHTGLCWIWGAFGWTQPRVLYNSSALSLQEGGWSPASRSTTSLSAVQLTRLRTNGYLAVTQLNGAHHPKTTLLRENSMGHFDIIGASQRVTIAVALASSSTTRGSVSVTGQVLTDGAEKQGKNVAEKTGTFSPPSFGHRDGITTRSENVLGIDQFKAAAFRSDSLESTTCPSATEEALSHRSGDKAFELSNKPVPWHGVQPLCVVCAEKDLTVEKLRAQNAHLEHELGRFLTQYESDLQSVSENLTKEKSLKEQFEKRLLQVTDSLSEEELDSWAAKLNEILDNYKTETQKRSASKEYTNPTLLTPVTRIVQKLKYMQNQAKLYKEQTALAENAASEYADKLDAALRQLTECESQLLTLREGLETSESRALKWEKEALEANEELEKAKNALRKKEQAMLDMQQSLDQLHADVEALQQERHKNKELQESLNYETRERKVAADKLATVENSKRRLQYAVNELEEELSNAKTSTERLEVRVSELTRELRSSQRSNEIQKAERERIEHELNRLHSSRDTLEEHVERLRKALLDAAAQALEQGKQEALERSELLGKLHTTEYQLQEARKQVTTLEQERKEWNDQERLRTFAVDAEKLQALAKRNQELQEEMEAIKTQTALQLKSLSERNVALLRQINNRISEEQETSKKQSSDFLAYQEELDALNLKCSEARKQYRTLLQSLKSLGLLGSEIDEKGKTPDEEVESQDKEVLETLSSDVDENELDAEDVARLVEQAVGHLREDLVVSTAAVDALAGQAEALELQLKLHDNADKDADEAPMPCKKCLRLQLKVTALEAEVLEKYKILEIVNAEDSASNVQPDGLVNADQKQNSISYPAESAGITTFSNASQRVAACDVTQVQEHGINVRQTQHSVHWEAPSNKGTYNEQYAPEFCRETLVPTRRVPANVGRNNVSCVPQDEGVRGNAFAVTQAMPSAVNTLGMMQKETFNRLNGQTQRRFAASKEAPHQKTLNVGRALINKTSSETYLNHRIQKHRPEIASLRHPTHFAQRNLPTDHQQNYCRTTPPDAPEFRATRCRNRLVARNTLGHMNVSEPTTPVVYVDRQTNLGSFDATQQAANALQHQVISPNYF